MVVLKLFNVIIAVFWKNVDTMYSNEVEHLVKILRGQISNGTKTL